MNTTKPIVILSFMLCLMTAGRALCQEWDLNDNNFFDIPMEELLDVPFSLASGQEEDAFKSASAAFIITAEDIEHSGATSIPELLRMAPGINYGRLNAGFWTISSRGFNGEFSDKLLVMIDNRIIYSGLFGGVFWDAQHIMLEDIEKIEIIRGPGGALWGANAVNGVINIVTKKASDTQGTLITAAAGKEVNGLGNYRHGGMINDHTYYRVWGQYQNTDESQATGDNRTFDAWQAYHAGVRIDSEPTEQDDFMFTGSFYQGQYDRVTGFLDLTTSNFLQTDFNQQRLDGFYLMGHWNHTFEDDSQLKIVTNFNQAGRREKTYKYRAHTFDFNFQHIFSAHTDHQVIWGAGYRMIADTIESTDNTLSFADAQTTNNIYSFFIQDKMTLIEDKLFFTLGSKFEYNNFSGFEFQPSGRLSWLINEEQMCWTAISRAVHTPTRFDMDATTTIGFAGPFKLTLDNEGIDSVNLLSYEVGYRNKISEKLMLDIALFYNEYNNLEFYETEFTYGNIKNILTNNMNGETYGGEMSANYKITPNWQVKAGYSFLQTQLHALDSGPSSSEQTTEGQSAQNQVSLISNMNLTPDISLDTQLYYVDNLPGVNVKHYTTLDARLAWQINNNTEIALVGQNLLDPQHQENFTQSNRANTEIQRAYFIKLTHKF